MVWNSRENKIKYKFVAFKDYSGVWKSMRVYGKRVSAVNGQDDDEVMNLDDVTQVVAEDNNANDMDQWDEPKARTFLMKLWQEFNK